MRSIELAAHAKINLSLLIKYRRPDGFHEIESVFQEIDWGDDLFLQEAEGYTFETNSILLREEVDNLCLKAAKLMGHECNIPGLYIRLIKRIPLGAGLGGGSSDAAAVLKGINVIYNLKLHGADLIALAAKLGSDIPFFINGGSAFVYGRGELIQPVEIDTNYTLILIHPEVSISTAWAYANLKMGLTKAFIKTKFIGFEVQNLSVENFRDKFSNDFEKSLFAAYPQLADCKQMLYGSGADFACMSGSGSTIYGLFRDDRQARSVYQELKTRFSCTLTRPVKRK